MTHIPWKQEFNLKPNSIVGYLVPGDGHYNCKRSKKSISNLTKSKEYYQTTTEPPHYLTNPLSTWEIMAMTVTELEIYQGLKKPTLKARTDGEMSPATRRRMMGLIDHFVAISPNNFSFWKEEKRWIKFKLNFITLTLPCEQRHSDNVIKKVCLQSFLDKIRKIHGVNHYLWKAELQENGNIHFHITTNRFIPYSDIRDLWNLALAKLEYYQRSPTGSTTAAQTGTQIRSVKNIKNFGAYLAGYFAKSPNQTKKGKPICSPKEKDENQTYSCIWEVNEDGLIQRIPIEGRVYGASESLTKLKTFRVQEGDRGYHDLCQLVQNPKVSKFQMDQAVIFHIKLNQIVKQFPAHFADQIVNHYRSLGLSAKESSRLAFCDPAFT